MGLSILKTPLRTLQANAFCERLVGSIRRECLDFLIPLNERMRDTCGEFSRTGWLITTRAARILPWGQVYLNRPKAFRCWKF
jgi:hypothetical protein